ncbi:hypothetical protein D6D24_03860 [Aureobasidium pullulans]|uniref:AMP-activated protein kinase glycogen-binding domain-containing protein n=1 Tax=Aureobasidium pullulans TaxID=5580 RepID=A0A4S8VYR7_AURPU|nr:hypothetical protein D6D24_03860 [Aureobasidium pullulans]
MGSYTFTWDHPAQEVYVTGDFDNWSKSIKLNKNGDSFHKTVTIPGEEHRVHYKFVVDGQWTTDWTAKQETDSSGNVNNVVEARELSPEPEERPAQAFISSVHPQSTTAALAGEVPLEKERNAHSEQSVDETNFPQETPGFEDLPGQFPVTPMADLKQFTVNPIPATDGPSNPVKLAPGEPVPHPSTLTSNTIQSTVRDDPELKKATSTSTDGANESRERELNENDLPGAYAPSTAREEKEDTKAFGITPIPATAGIGNPIKLAPGEPVPHHSKITSNTIQSTVRDGSQYGVSDTGAPVLPPVLDSQSEAEANGASMFNLPSIGGNMIPESSLPMGGDSQLPNFDNAFSSSVAPQSTTAQLAGQVPREPRGVPEVVSESQESAHVSPEASSSAKAVQSKHDVEEELKEKVPEANASAESGPVTGVPEVVTDSQHAAHTGPEAAANPEAVREKAAVESELKQTIPEENATSQRSPVADAASSVSQTVASVPETVSNSHVPEAVAGGLAAAGATAIGAALLAKDKISEAYTHATEPTTASKQVPDVVTESQERAHVEPEASASPEVVREKAAFEDELKHSIPEAPATSESGLLGASEGGLAGKIAAGTAAAGTAAAGLAYAARNQATNAYENAGSPLSNLTKEPTIDGSVPEVVTESQERAHVQPEASASPEAVREKTAMEGELLSEVSKAPATSESGILGKSEQGITDKATAGVAAASAAVSTQANKAYESVAPQTQSLTGSSGFNQRSIESDAASQQVPEVVHESQERAHVDPEASANPEAVHEKHDMESELLSHVHKAPATSESGVFGNSEQGITGKAAAGIAAGAAALGATAAGAAYSARDKAAEVTGQDTTVTSKSVDDSVPEVVHESQERAHVAPEASANPEAVHEKHDMESELLSHVHKAPATSESGALGTSERGISGKATAGIAAGTAALGATAAGVAYTARDKAAEATGTDANTILPSSIQSAIDNMNQGLPPTNSSLASPATHSSVPEAVLDSQHQAHVGPEASAQPEVVAEKSDVERELLDRVPRTDEAGEPAPTESAALSATAPVKPTSDIESAVLGAGAGAGASTTGVAAVSGIQNVASSSAAPVSYNTTVPSSSSRFDDEAPRDLTGGHSALPTTTQAATTEAGAFTENTGLSGATTSATPIYNEETSAIAASTGLNAPADSQAQIPAPKSEQLAAPTLAAPTEQSRDVSPMTRPDSSKQSEPQVTTGTETHTVPATTGSAPTTPQRHATKRSSGFFRGTPQSDRTSVAGSSKVDEDGKPKKKGFLAKLKEKFRG